MSKADDMFKELGYEKQCDKDDNEHFITFIKYLSLSDRISISFECWNNSISVCYSDDDYEYEGAYYFNIQVLKAINKKIEELGWEE